MHLGTALVVAGGSLQILGVILVFVQISAAEKLLGVTPWLVRLAGSAWRQLQQLAGRFGLRRKITLTPLTATVHATTTGTARLTVTRIPGTTVDERLESLKLELDDVRGEVDELREKSAIEAADLKRRLAEIESGIRATDASLRALIEALTIGSRHIQVFGASFIVLGTVLVTIGAVIG